MLFIKKLGLLFVFSILLCGSLFSSDSNRSERNYAVQLIDGVPMITIDDKPVRARIFWGRFDSGISFDTTPEKKTVNIDFVSSQDAEKKGTIHFRFGKNAGEIVIGDLSITEEKTGKIIAGPYSFESEQDFSDHWKIYNHRVGEDRIADVGILSGSQESPKGLKITIHPPKAGRPIDFHLYHAHNLDLKQGHSYRVHFTIRSDTPRTVNMKIFRPGEPYITLNHQISADGHVARQTKLAADADVHFISFLFRDCWKTKDGKWDWTMLDAECDTILAANPKALLIPRPGMNAPQWWLHQNPDEKMVWKDTKSFTLQQGKNWASPASLKYRAAACEALGAMIEHLEQKYGSSIAGYHPYGQNSGEWFTANTWGGGLSGFGIAEGRSWRTWLRKKYESDSNLRKAWGDPAVSLENAAVPSADIRRASMSVPVLDPKIDPKNQILIDFNEWTQKEMTDTILALAKTIREKTKGRKLSLFFYGYSFEFGGIFKGPAASAHYNIRALLDSPDIDMICSPISYFDRQPGGGCCCMLTAESVEAAGKMYLYEDDTRTPLAHGSTAPGHESGSDSIEETQHLLSRNTAECAIRNFGTWWMDLGGTGWFEDPRLWDTMRDLAKMDEYFLKNPTPYLPEIGVFLDEQSVLKITSGRYSQEMISLSRRAFNRLGAPYGQYLLSDLLEGKIAPPRLCAILNPKCLSENQIRKIKKITKDVSLIFINFEGITEDSLRDAARKANVHLYTQESCNVWANGPYAVLHGAQDGSVHFSNPLGKPIYDGITGKKLFNGPNGVLPLKLGETRILFLTTP